MARSRRRGANAPIRRARSLRRLRLDAGRVSDVTSTEDDGGDLGAEISKMPLRMDTHDKWGSDKPVAITLPQYAYLIGQFRSVRVLKVSAVTA